MIYLKYKKDFDHKPMHLINMLNLIYTSNLNNTPTKSSIDSKIKRNFTLNNNLHDKIKFIQICRNQSVEGNKITNNVSSDVKREKVNLSKEDNLRDSSIDKFQPTPGKSIKEKINSIKSNLDKNLSRTEVLVESVPISKNQEIVIKIESDSGFDPYDGSSNTHEQVSFSLQQWKILDRLSELAVIEEGNNVSLKVKSYEERINKLESNINQMSDNTKCGSKLYEKSKSA